MIKIGILGEIGSGKTFIAKKFKFPVFSADEEVTKIYQKNKLCFLKLKKKLEIWESMFIRLIILYTEISLKEL